MKFIILSLFCGLFVVQVATLSRISEESDIRELATNILQDRVRRLEAHFVGHTVILGKEGKGISIVPCKLDIDKECYRDDTGINIHDMKMEGWDIGVLEAAGEATVPQSPKKADITIKNSTFRSNYVESYSGPNDWHLRFTLFWGGIKQAFSELWN